MTHSEFTQLSSFDQHRVKATQRAGRTNRQCLEGILGDLPKGAIAFHTTDDGAVFLIGTDSSWVTQKIDKSQREQLSMIGMSGSLGWELEPNGSLSKQIERLAQAV